MEKILEKSLKRYVLGAIEGGRCYYLKVRHTPIPGQLLSSVQYECTFDIESATKATSRNIMESVLETYLRNVGDDALDFVVISLEISFSLIKEISE